MQLTTECRSSPSSEGEFYFQPHKRKSTPAVGERGTGSSVMNGHASPVPAITYQRPSLPVSSASIQHHQQQQQHLPPTLPPPPPPPPTCSSTNLSQHPYPVLINSTSPTNIHVNPSCETSVTSGSSSLRPCYLCTVTCCDTANCSKSSQFPPPQMSASIVASSNTTGPITTTGRPRFLQRTNSEMAPRTTSGRLPVGHDIQRPSSVASFRNCPMCVDPNTGRLLCGSPPIFLYSSSLTSSPQNQHNQQNFLDSGRSVSQQSSNTTCTPLPSSQNNPSRQSTPIQGRKTSFREKPKLHIFIPEKSSRNIPSPDFSSGGSASGQYHRHSSFTDYTDTCTPPICSSTTPGGISNSNMDFTIAAGSATPTSGQRKVALLTDQDYQQLYLTGRGAEKHGFFRKAVPALPIVVAILFCVFNLLLPGSGTLLASVTIIFGTPTEYGPGYGCRSFFICFLSAILQFSTAIFVFGWVWSIMWGIVFIKNSLRYGEKRDINTITLC